MFIFVSVYSLGSKRGLTERVVFADEDGKHYTFERIGADSFWDFIDYEGQRISFETNSLQIAKVLAEILIVEGMKNEK